MSKPSARNHSPTTGASPILAFADHPVTALFVSIVFLLVCATGIGLLVRQLRPARQLRDYFKRLTSWWIVTGVMFLVVSTAPLVGGMLFAVLILLALKECSQALWPQQRALLAAALLWIVVSLGHVLAWLLRGEEPALLLFFWTLLLTQLNDIAQYFAGKALGRHRITPHISPNKTLEGLLGGVVFSVLVSLVVSPLLLSLGLWQSFVFGLLIALGGFAGDILFSWIKRRAGIKDFGAVLPGQGGVLDRLDSVTCTGPLVYYFMLIFAS